MTLSPGTVGYSNAGGYQSQEIYNALVPPEGPRMVPYVADFPTAAIFEVDFTMTMQQQRMTVVQSVFIDARNATASVSLSVEGTQLVIELEAGDQGFFPLLVPKTGAKFLISSSSTAPVTIIFINVPVPADVWHTQPVSLGTVAVSGQLAPISAAGVDPLATAQLGGATVWTDHSVASTAAATSAPLFGASSAGVRSFVRVKAPETADLWVNPKGGTAGISAVGCFKIPSGTLYENFPGESVYEAWTYYCATGSLVIFAQSQ